MRLIRIFLPKGFFTWCGTLVLFGLLVFYYGSKVVSFSGLLLIGIVCGGAVVAAKLVRDDVVERIELVPPFPRIILYAPFAYVVITSLAILSDARSLRSWWEPVTVTGGVSFTAANGLGILAAVIAAFTQRRYGRKIPLATQKVRGPGLISHEEAKAIAESELGPEAGGFVWGAVRLAFSHGPEHFCIVGEPGSGKTKSIQILLKSVLATIGPGSNRRAVLYDAKQDMISTLASFKLTCPVITLHPFDKRGWAWDIAADVTNPMLAIEIATILIPEKVGERQPYFPNAARALLSGVMESLHRSAAGRWTLRDVVLALRYPKRMKELLKTSKDTRYLIEKYVTGKTSDQDVASTIENSMRRLSFIAAGWDLAGENKISFSEWVETGESVLILGRSPSVESTFIELNRAILFRLAQLIRNQSNADRAGDGRPPRQTWVVVDELSESGKLDGFNSLLKEGRSKGACAVIGFQDMHSLEEVYGPRLGRELVGICRNKAFLRTTDPDTQKYASDCFGAQDLDLARFSNTEGWSKEGYSTSASESYQRLTQPVVLSSQFGSDLRPASRRDGLSGFYMTAAVPQPYFANLPGEYVAKAIGESDGKELPEKDRDFVPRFGQDAKEISLREWDEGDLQRLNLQGHTQLLETDAGEQTKPSAESWSGILGGR